MKATRWVIAGPDNTFYIGSWNAWGRPHMAGIEKAVMYNSEAEARTMHKRFAQRTPNIDSNVVSVSISYKLKEKAT